MEHSAPESDIGCTSIALCRRPLHFSGSNLVCTAVHLALTRLFDDHVVDGEKPYIGTLVVQVDNCVGENKNHILIGYLASLVGRGIIGNVQVQFMPIGHTHILIDQIFSK